MRYVSQSLNSLETQALLSGSTFQTLAPITGNPAGPRASYVSDLPAHSEPSDEYISVFVQQAQVPAVSSPLNLFSIGVSGCGRDAPCASVRAQAELSAQELASQRRPLDGMGISAVLYGDANHDGLTDVLIRFSNGTGTLYRAEPPPPQAHVSTPISSSLPPTNADIDAGIPATTLAESEDSFVDLVVSAFYLYLVGESLHDTFFNDTD